MFHFLCASAGTGKSTVMRAIISHFQRKYHTKLKDKVAITAATGIAATHINGANVWAAWGLGAQGSWAGN